MGLLMKFCKGFGCGNRASHLKEAGLSRIYSCKYFIYTDGDLPNRSKATVKVLCV